MPREPRDVLALGLRRRSSAMPGRQQQLAAGQERRRVLELGDVDPAHGRVELVAAGHGAHVEVGEQVAEGQHRQTGRRVSPICTNVPDARAGGGPANEVLGRRVLGTRAPAADRRSCCCTGSAWTARCGIRSCRCSRASTRWSRSTCRASAPPRRSTASRPSRRSPPPSEALGLERPHVAGNSLGGGIALELGRRGWAGSVCAISPIGFAAGRERALRARDPEHDPRDGAHGSTGSPSTAYGGPVRRTALMSLIVARPWRTSRRRSART